MSFKPLLAGKAPADLSTLRYPVLASPKLDGIRCIKLGGRALTRKLKPVPNDFVREWVEQHLPDGIDGELLLSDWTRPFSEVSSAIMSRDGEPDFCFAAFDMFSSDSHSPENTFRYRLFHLTGWAIENNPDNARLAVVPHELAESPEELCLLIADHIAQGFEGTMVRDPNGYYKFGRSTTKEGILLKIKSFADEEATVVGVEPWHENQNPQERDALGHSKRSHKQEGKVAVEKLGALVCRFDDGTEFSVGSGFTEEQRVALWETTRGSGDWARVKVKYQAPPGGRKPGEAPRFPVFLGFRSEED